ncbi:MAG: sigma 54-interacting transcriptional regulator [Firmicutes bacterium]|nr:sigma 54-interacting transcriptional regulator [Bacillota bacterium]
MGVSDLGKILYYDQGNGLILGIQPGDAIKEGSLPDIAIKTWRRVAKKVSKEIYGEPYMGISVPIKSDNSVIGTYFVSRPADKEEKLQDMARDINDSIATLSGYSVSEDETVAAKIPKASQQNLARRKLNSLDVSVHTCTRLKRDADRRYKAGYSPDHIKELKSLHNGADYTFNHLVFSSKAMGDLVSVAKKISMNDTSVLICGESGTGKEILAHAIHNSSPRRHGPFVAVNCAAFPKELIPSELFGYEEGTFTGAIKGGKAGIFELASGGTIFLDEIGDMPLSAQANLLRVLQEKQITRVGGHREIPLDVRIIAATNKNLPALAQKKLFRQDLYYRLKVMVFSIPPLRDRREDIAHFYAGVGHLPGDDRVVIPGYQF